MRELLAKKNIVLMLAILLLTVLVIAAANGKYVFPVARRALMEVMQPLETALTGASGAVSKAGRLLSSVMSTYEENFELRKEISSLRKSNIEAAEIWAENQRLRELLNFKQSQGRYILLTARVVGHSPGGFAGDIIIDKGDKDHITRDMSVVTADGLVGNISEVYRNSARVRLILHPGAAVGGMVQRSVSRVAGIVSGNASTPQTPNLVNLSRDADIIDGDIIITSGFGGIYPKGVVVGTVQKVVNAEGGLLKYAVIVPVVDFSRLEEVMVITNVADFSQARTGAAGRAGERP